MSFRFRRSLKLAPGVRLNLSGSGLSMTVGPRGASVNFGPRGTYVNSGIPGTGLYSRQRLASDEPRSSSGPSSRVASGAGAAPTVTVAISIQIDDETGAISFKDDSGQPASEAAVRALKKQKAPELRAVIEKYVADCNARIEALSHIHWATPSPDEKPKLDLAPFDEPEPATPEPPTIGLIDRLLWWRRQRKEEEYSVALALALRARDEWLERKARDAGKRSRRRIFVESEIYASVDAMESYLEEKLRAIEWPRETNVTFEITNDGAKVSLDVDLPEVEDMPTKSAYAASRTFEVRMKPIAKTVASRMYLDHVNGIGFRVIGETFASLPRCEEVVLSAYTQRPDRSTGNIRDEYVYSVRVPRKAWQLLNFGSLKLIDVSASLARFELRRDMNSAGELRAIDPIR